MEDFWGEPISVYTREQGLEDGVLVDVSEMAREAGFKVPTAVTAAVWADIKDIPPRFQGIQDPAGRLWDLLWMGSLIARKSERSEFVYKIIMHQGRTTYYFAKMVISPGDNGAAVITIMQPGED